MTTPEPAIDRIPLAHTVRYAARGLPELPYQYGRGTLVPTEITLTYRAAPDSQLGRVYAYVVGQIHVDGQKIPHGPYGQHYHQGLDGWPDWLTEEVRLHDPDAPSAEAQPEPAAGTGQPDLAEIRAIARRLAAHAVGFQDVLDDSDRDPWARTVRADLDALNAALAAGVAQPDAETDRRLRAAAFTAAYWHQAAIDRDDIPAAHSIACIRGALNGETRPEHLGLDDADAFHAAVSGRPAAGDTSEEA